MVSSLDFPLVLQVKLSVVDRLHSQSNRFAVGVENEVIGDLKLNCSPVGHIHKIFLSTGVEHKLAMEAHAGGIS